MEPADSFPASRPKRKSDGDDLLVSDFLTYVSLSPPHKKSRQELGTPSTVRECQSIALPMELQEQVCAAPLDDLEMAVNLQELQPLPTPNDERALVLYKPVNPPLFPGGPSAGTSIRLKPAGLFSSGMLHARSLLATKGSGHFSLPALGGSTVVIEEIDDEDDRIIPEESSNNTLAMIPWLPNSSTGMDMSALPTQQVASAQHTEVAGLGIASMDAEAMEEDSENSQSNNSVTSFTVEPWQHYGIPQSQYGPVMWSH